MTTIAVMRKALEALGNCTSEHGHRCSRCDSEVDPNGEAITALRAELERLEAVEPVEFQAREVGEGDWFRVGLDEKERIAHIIKSPRMDYRWLYTAPIAPAIPALTIEDVAASAPEFADVPKYGPAYLAGAYWAYTLAAARTGARIVKAATIVPSIQTEATE